MSNGIHLHESQIRFARLSIHGLWKSITSRRHALIAAKSNIYGMPRAMIGILLSIRVVRTPSTPREAAAAQPTMQFIQSVGVQEELPVCRRSLLNLSSRSTTVQGRGRNRGTSLLLLLLQPARMTRSQLVCLSTAVAGGASSSLHPAPFLPR